MGEQGSAAAKFGEQDIAGLLCMPQALTDMIEACMADKSPQPLAEIALQDTALAAKILLAANKTSTRPLDSTEPLTSAIQHLGVPMVTGITLQAAKQLVCHHFSDTALVFQYGLWFSSRVASVSARCLAPSINYPYIEEAQLSGLMLNLGIHALFARYGDEYVVADVNSWSSSLQCRFEHSRYKTDHLHIADQLIALWGVDSFLADAVLFVHADLAQIEKNSSLLKIARFAQQFCRNPDALTPAAEALGARLFGLRKSEVDYLFDWAHGLYPPYADRLSEPEKLREDLGNGLERLTELIFMLADQEAARARLGHGDSPQALATIARQLYLENSTATDAVFFLLDRNNQQLTGIPAAGQPRMVAELKIPYEEDASLAARAIWRGETLNSFTAETTVTVTDRLLIRLIKGDGIHCQPLRFEGQSVGVVVLGAGSRQDIELFKVLQLRMFAQVVSAALVRLSIEGRERLNDGNSLLRRVSHEVNNPLTVIGNYAEVLNHLLRDDENRELPEAIKKEVKRIDDILNYYLNQQEIPEFPENNVDLNQLLQDTVATLNESEIKPRAIELQLTLKEDLERLATNPVLVKQIFVNLLKNAAEALGQGGRIRLSTRENYLADGGRHAEVIVHDSGPGIAPQIQAQLFRPVSSSKGAGHGGVGLSIVKTMVDDLGGRISCHSSAAEGTSFHLLLPYKNARPFDG